MSGTSLAHSYLYLLFSKFLHTLKECNIFKLKKCYFRDNDKESVQNFCKIFYNNNNNNNNNNDKVKM